VSKTQKIVNMLADDTAAPAAARTLAKAAEQEGKLISEYLTERLNSDYARPVTPWDKTNTAATAGGERRQAEGEGFVPSERPPTYKEPREAIAMVLAYRDQIKFLDRLKLAKAMKGLALDTALARLIHGGRFSGPAAMA
jgi:hypothetical protein